jgi:hypothetical protein
LIKEDPELDEAMRMSIKEVKIKLKLKGRNLTKCQKAG